MEINFAICWIVIYPVDSANKRLNNRGQVRVVQKVANTINQRISFPNTHAVDRLNNWGQVITIQWILKYQWLLSHYPLNPVDISCSMQRAKKVVSHSPGLVHYFAIGLVILVLNLPNRQVLFFAEIHITEGL